MSETRSSPRHHTGLWDLLPQKQPPGPIPGESIITWDKHNFSLGLSIPGPLVTTGAASEPCSTQASPETSEGRLEESSSGEMGRAVPRGSPPGTLLWLWLLHNTQNEVQEDVPWFQLVRG